MPIRFSCVFHFDNCYQTTPNETSDMFFETLSAKKTTDGRNSPLLVIDEAYSIKFLSVTFGLVEFISIANNILSK